jgi:hypothetical protein
MMNTFKVTFKNDNSLTTEMSADLNEAHKRKTKKQSDKEASRRDALIAIIKNTRINKTLKSALVMNAKIAGHYYTESEEHILALGDDLIKLGEKIKKVAKEIK